MHSLAEIWPPYQLRITEGDLELRIIRDEDLPELLALAQAGVHDPGFMPFSHPWTDADPGDLPAEFLRYHWSSRARFTPERFTLDFAVRRAGEIVGTQAISTESYAVTRTGETGSWLGRRFHGQGIGTRMRSAVCAFVFDHLDATEITSAAFVDNPSSLGVSRKVGYVPNGIKRVVRRGSAAANQQLALTLDTFIRGEPITVSGADALRSFVGLNALQ